MIRRIGFIGLGLMGRPMANNLLKSGYDLTVHDINREAVKEVRLSLVFATHWWVKVLPKAARDKTL